MVGPYVSLLDLYINASYSKLVKLWEEAPAGRYLKGLTLQLDSWLQ